MAKEKQSITEKVYAKVARQAAKEIKAAQAKHKALVDKVKQACAKFTDLEYVDTGKGKTTLVVYADRKIGVMNTKLQACAVHDGKVGYVNVTIAEFVEWVEAVTAKIDEENG